MRARVAALALLGGLVAGAAALGGGCERDQVASGPPIGGAQLAVIGGGLPVRDFIQLPRMCPGAQNDLDIFETGVEGVTKGTLFGVFAASGKIELRVRELDGTTSPVAAEDFYVDKPLAGSTSSFRVVCTTRGTLIDRGPGPAGQVFSFDKTQGTEIVCWANPDGTSTWTETVIATAAVGEPADAFWLVAMAGADTDDVEDPSAFEVVYLRDAEYAPWMRTSIGRASREGLFFARVTLAPNGAGTPQVFEQDSFPDWRDDAREALGPMDCAGHCGMQLHGVDWTDCGGCPSGEACHDGKCSTGACTPKGAAEACADLPGQPACGQRSDGCGGVVTCPACPSGLVCGAGGDLDRCGQRPVAMTIDRLRALYRDKAGLLCGQYLDPETGIDVMMDTGCASCVNNLCLDQPLPPCIPSSGLGQPDQDPTPPAEPPDPDAGAGAGAP